MKHLIITHPGKAHFDEFLAISLILAVHENTAFTIERRSPTPAELDNPDIWVVDIGERHEKELKNFDHHQDLNMSVSFVLVADYLNLAPKLENAPWWSFKDKMDRFGPVNTAREMGIQNLLPLYSPLEEWFVGEFEKNPASVSKLMAAFGGSIIRKAESVTSRMNFWKGCETKKIKNKTVLIGYSTETVGLQEYCDTLETPIDISLTFDNRGDGWRMRRINESRGVDFSILENHAEIAFAHKGGFIAKTKKKLPLDQVFELVAKAIG